MIANHIGAKWFWSDAVQDCGDLILMLEGLSDDEIVGKIAVAVLGKKKALGGHGTPQDIAKSSNRPMILIGG